MLIAAELHVLESRAPQILPPRQFQSIDFKSDGQPHTQTDAQMQGAQNVNTSSNMKVQGLA